MRKQEMIEMARKLECRHCGTFNEAGTVCMCRRYGPPIDQDALGWRKIHTAPLEKKIIVYEQPQYGDHSIEIGIVLLNGDGERVTYIGNKSAAVTHWMALPQHKPVDA